MMPRASGNLDDLLRAKLHHQVHRHERDRRQDAPRRKSATAREGPWRQMKHREANVERVDARVLFVRFRVFGNHAKLRQQGLLIAPLVQQALLLAGKWRLLTFCHV
jgi:hypothetical protein